MDYSPIQRFKHSLASYFRAEKNGGLLLMTWGLISSFSGWYLFMKVGSPVYEGVAYPLIAVAVVHLLVGATIFFRTKNQVAKLSEGLRLFPEEMLTSEKERMELVLANFERFKTVEMLLLFLGFAFLLGGLFGGFGDFMLGTGIGLSLQSALSLVFDLFAAFRATFYNRALEKFERTLR